MSRAKAKYTCFFCVSKDTWNLGMKTAFCQPLSQVWAIKIGIIFACLKRECLQFCSLFQIDYSSRPELLFCPFPLFPPSPYIQPLWVKTTNTFYDFILKPKVQLFLCIFTFLPTVDCYLIVSEQWSFHLVDYSKALLFSLIPKFSPQASSTKQLLQI